MTPAVGARTLQSNAIGLDGGFHQQLVVEREERSVSTAAQNNCFRVPRSGSVSYVLVVLDSLLIVLVGCLRRELKRVGNGVEGRPCHHSERRTQLQYQSGLFRWCNAVVGDRFSSVLGNLWLAEPKGASRSSKTT